jgi:serine/threonine-protein kinase
VEKGTILKKGDEIDVVVSKGALVEVPNLIGKKSEKAEKAAEEANLVYSVSGKEYSDDVKKGVVISQSIEAGNTVEEQQTVEVVVSKGIEQVEVPDVGNMTLKKAKKALEKAKLTYETGSDYSSSVDEGKIISQSIDAGKKVDKNTKVKIVVSLGKKPEATTASTSSTRSSSSSGGSRKKTSSKKKSSSDNINSWDVVN